MSYLRRLMRVVLVAAAEVEAIVSDAFDETSDLTAKIVQHIEEEETGEQKVK